MDIQTIMDTIWNDTTNRFVLFCTLGGSALGLLSAGLLGSLIDLLSWWFTSGFSFSSALANQNAMHGDSVWPYMIMNGMLWPLWLIIALLAQRLFLSAYLPIWLTFSGFLVTGAIIQPILFRQLFKL